MLWVTNICCARYVKKQALQSKVMLQLKYKQSKQARHPLTCSFDSRMRATLTMSGDRSLLLPGTEVNRRRVTYREESSVHVQRHK